MNRKIRQACRTGQAEDERNRAMHRSAQAENAEYQFRAAMAELGARCTATHGIYGYVFEKAALRELRSAAEDAMVSYYHLRVMDDGSE